MSLSEFIAWTLMLTLLAALIAVAVVVVAVVAVVAGVIWLCRKIVNHYRRRSRLRSMNDTRASRTSQPPDIEGEPESARRQRQTGEMKETLTRGLSISDQTARTDPPRPIGELTEGARRQIAIGAFHAYRQGSSVSALANRYKVDEAWLEGELAWMTVSRGPWHDRSEDARDSLS
jgi:hypothetical protein